MILLMQVKWNVSSFLASPSFIFHVSQPYKSTDFTNELHKWTLALTEQLEDFHILFNFLNTVLSFPILHVISSPPPLCAVTTQPRYVNLSVSSRFWPLKVIGSVLFPFILITLDFLLFTLSPVLAACSCSLSVFLCIICWVGDRCAISSAKSRSSSFVVNFHLIPVSIFRRLPHYKV